MGNFADAANIERVKAEAESVIDAAAALGAKYVRAHAFIPSGKTEDDSMFSTVKSAIFELAKKAEKSGVIILLESMGLFANTEKLAEVAETQTAAIERLQPLIL